MNGYEIRKQLNHYRDMRRAEAMDALIARVCCAGLVVFVILGLLGVA